MKKVLVILISFIFLSTHFAKLSAQVNAPDLRCISCNAAGDLTLTWIVPPDPSAQFFSYEIYHSIAYGGPYTIAGTVNTRTINTFTHLGAGGNVQSQFYYVITKWGAAGASGSTAVDTLKSIFLNLTNTSGVAGLSYNNLHTPKLPTSSANFKINREYPTLTWTNIKNTTALNYNDTVTICTAILKYQIEESDAVGCVSSSNIQASLFKDLTPPKNAFLDSVSVNAGGQTYLGWNPSPSGDCTGYVIYQQNGAGAWIPIDTVYGLNNTAYTTTNTTSNNSSVNYCIAAIDSCKNISPLGTAQQTIFLKAKYDLCGRSAQLTWNNYQNLPLGILKYNVYCSVNAGPYNFVGSTNSNSYTHGGLVPSKTYCYVVRVFNVPQVITSTSNLSCFIASAPPATSFVYVKTATVAFAQYINVNLFSDTLKPCKGFNLYKSDDGINFNIIAFLPYSPNGFSAYSDVDVRPSEKNYFYKAEIVDSCGNSRYMSNTGKTILLKVKNDNTFIFNNNLSWDNYSSWLGGVAGYNIFRVINDSAQVAPVDFVPVGTTTYTDNVEDVYPESGKIGYFVQAVENFGNPYGFTDASASNVAYCYVEATVFVPSSFAPKGKNNIWLPKSQFVEKSDYSVRVFNRWGEQVFDTGEDNKGWDGSNMESGTYVYLIEYRNARGEFVQLKGTVTML